MSNFPHIAAHCGESVADRVLASFGGEKRATAQQVMQELENVLAELNPERPEKKVEPLIEGVPDQPRRTKATMATYGSVYGGKPGA